MSSWFSRKDSKPSAPPAQPKPSAPPAPSAPSAPPSQRAPSLSQGPSGDLFAGLQKKQSGPSAPHAPAPSAPPVSPQPSAPVAHHASSPFNPASVSASAPPAASANSFSMFSGLSVKPSAPGGPPAPLFKNPSPPAGPPPGLPPSGFAPVDRSSPAPPAGPSQAENGLHPNRAASSPFAFIDQQDSGEGNDAAPADGDGSAFDFLGGGGDGDQHDQKEQVPGAGGLLDFSGMSLRGPSHGGPLPGSARADSSDAVSVVSDATTSTHRSSIVHGAGLAASLVKGGEMDHKPIDVDSDGEEQANDEAAAERQRALREQQLNARLTAIRKTLDDALVAHWLAVKHAQEQELGMRDHEKSCLASLKESEDQLKETEAQQIAAIEAEEYEKADQLNDTIEKIKRKISGVQVSMKQTSAKHSQIQDQRAVSLQSLLRSVKECTETLNQIQQIQEQSLEAHVTKQTASLNEAEDKLNAQFDRVDRVLTHVADDLKHAVEEEQTVEADIRAQTQDVEAEKSALLDKEKTLMEEYEELARKLREKEQELRVCRTQLDEVGAKITSTRTKHERKIKRIQEKKDRILTEQRSAQREHSVLEAQRAQLDARSERVHAKTAELTELIRTIKFEVKGTTFLMERLQEDESRQKEWRAADQKVQEDTRSLADQLSATIKEIETGRASLVEIEQETTKQREIIAQSDSDVPRLENEKKMAVTAKNFKKAAQASADIKTCQANKEAAISKISELGAQGAKTEEDVRIASARKADLQDRLNKAEYDTDLRRIKTLLERLYTSEALLESVESLLPSLLSAGAAQNKDRPSASLEAEADALRYETSALAREVKELRAKHKWADDFPHVQRPKPSQVARHLVRQEEKEEEPVPEQPKRGAQKSKDAKNHKGSVDEEEESQPGESGEEKAAPAASAPAGFDPVKQRKDRQALLQKVSDLEGKLDLAIANEAFDEADQLQADIDASKQKISDIEKELTSRELSLTDPEPEPEPAPAAAVEEKAKDEPAPAAEKESEPAAAEETPAPLADEPAGGGDDENAPSAFDFTQSDNN